MANAVRNTSIDRLSRYKQHDGRFLWDRPFFICKLELGGSNASVELYGNLYRSLQPIYPLGKESNVNSFGSSGYLYSSPPTDISLGRSNPSRSLYKFDIDAASLLCVSIKKAESAFADSAFVDGLHSYAMIGATCKYVSNPKAARLKHWTIQACSLLKAS